MRQKVDALRAAIDLYKIPSRVRAARREPLPEGMTFLLSLAAGDGPSREMAATITGLPGVFLGEAAMFYIEQVLLFPGADSYRVLGCDARASAPELRRNMALLLRWLHPDIGGPRTVFAGRITAAWDDLKTDARRTAYAQRQQTPSSIKVPRSLRQSGRR